MLENRYDLLRTMQRSDRPLSPPSSSVFSFFAKTLCRRPSCRLCLLAAFELCYCWCFKEMLSSVNALLSITDLKRDTEVRDGMWGTDVGIVMFVYRP